MSKTRLRRCITTTARRFLPCSVKWSIYRAVLLSNPTRPPNNPNKRLTPKRLTKHNSYRLPVWVSLDCSNNLRNINIDKLCSHNSVTLWKWIEAQQLIRYYLAKCSLTAIFYKRQRRKFLAVVLSWSRRHHSTERKSCSKVTEILIEKITIRWITYIHKGRAFCFFKMSQQNQRT